MCVFFAQCTQIREFRPGFRPMKFHLEFQYVGLNFENASSVVRYYFEDSTFSLFILLFAPSEAEFADRL